MPLKHYIQICYNEFWSQVFVPYNAIIYICKCLLSSLWIGFRLKVKIWLNTFFFLHKYRLQVFRLNYLSFKYYWINSEFILVQICENITSFDSFQNWFLSDNWKSVMFFQSSFINDCATYINMQTTCKCIPNEKGATTLSMFQFWNVFIMR